jgi:hypothetical protein
LVSTPTKIKGRPTTYKPIYCEKIVDFFSPPHYKIKTKDGITTMSACDPVFLSDFARSIGVSVVHYSQIFAQWANKNPDFNDALKRAKELEVERIRVNAIRGLYNATFSIFTLKNIAGWRDQEAIVDQSTHYHLTSIQKNDRIGRIQKYIQKV